MRMRVGEAHGAARRFTPHIFNDTQREHPIRWRGRHYPPGGLFMPDLILPDQLLHRGLPLTPEKRLCIAVFTDCLHRLHQAMEHPRTRKSRIAANRELDWIRDRRDTPYSFESLCAILDLDASAIRRVLERAWARAFIGAWKG